MELVWLIDECVWAKVVSRGAFHCIVSYELDGFSYKEIIDNDSFMESSDMGIGYESYE
jgi:hypothetical protein